jgi:hypothetical protein
VGLQPRLVGVFERVTLVEVKLVIVATTQQFAQGAISCKVDVVEQVRQTELVRFLGLGVQNSLGRGRYQKGLGNGAAEIVTGEQAVHVAQPDEGLADSHGDGRPG